MSSSRPLVSHAGTDVSFSFVKNTGNGGGLRFALAVGVRKPLLEGFFIKIEGVCKICADCV